MIDSLFFSVLLSLIFVMHALEEYFLFDESAPSTSKLIGGAFLNKRVFGYTIMFLGILIIGTIFSNYVVASSLTHSLVVIILFGLLTDAILHFTRILISRRFIPGSITAFFLVVPLVLYIFIYDARDIAPGAVGFLEYALVAAVVMPVAIFVCFWLGFFVGKLFADQHFYSNGK